MADTNKKEYTSNLHPKGDLDTTVYPNVKSENIIDKDLTSYTAGKVPDSSLVSKSLDGISENLETTKIQVEANKTNIATNTQNIENLSAVTPNGINVDANGYAILEHDGTEINGQTKKVKFAQIDKIVSFSEVTIPTVSDLKTQDGSTFSGGSKLYNGTEYLPTFDIATLKDTYVDINSDQTIIGTKTWENNTTQNIGNIVIGKTKDDNPINLIQLAKEFYFMAFPKYNFSSRYYMKLGRSTISMETGGMTYFNLGSNIVVTFSYPSRIEFNPNKDFKIKITDTDATINDSPIVTKATLVTHTVEIHYASNGSYFCFTGTSDKNTPIDSVEKLTTVFGNRDLGGVGIFGSAGLSKIHVGTSINDTTFKTYMNNGEYANPSEETFATVFNTTGFTITDSVSAL